MKADIHRLLDLQRLLLMLSQVERVALRRHDEQYIPENDTEHSYNLAMTAWYLAQYFPELDRDKLIRYSLAHDLVEIYAGDTYIYGSKEMLESKEEREREALHKLEAEWADFADIISTIHTYEEKGDAESRFVYALDKIMPIMLIFVNEGYSWGKEGVTVDMLYQAKREKVRVSPEVLPYFEALHTLLLSRPDLIKRS